LARFAATMFEFAFVEREILSKEWAFNVAADEDVVTDFDDLYAGSIAECARYVQIFDEHHYGANFEA
jgi:hypothetical protein